MSVFLTGVYRENYWVDSNRKIPNIFGPFEFMQQDGRKKRTAKLLSVTNVTGLLFACFVGNSLNIDVFLIGYKNICLKESEVWRKVFSNKIIVTLVAQGLPVLLCKFTNCPRRDFAQKAKSGGGILVTRAYIKESTYS